MYHVKIHEGNTEAEVVLEEHPFELVVQELRASQESVTSPGIKCSTLEL